MSNLKLHLPEDLRNASDEFTQALIKAIDLSDQKVTELISACIDNLFLVSANGRYLVQLGEQEGFTMPANSGLDIRAYKVLVPLMVSAPKQVRRTIDQMLQAFYGIDRTKPSLTAAVAEPYNLASGDDLIVETESGKIGVAALADQVSDITNVTAAELAAVINTLQDLFQADTTIDRSTGRRYLRVSSKAEGASAFIRVAGGTMQNVLQFLTARLTAQTTGTIWNMTKSQPYDDVTRFTWNGTGVNPKAYLVKPGDTLTIRGLFDSVLPQSLLNGSYEVLDSGYDYVVVRNSTFNYDTATVTQFAANTFWFTGQERSLIYDQPEFAISSETEFNTATVTVPAIPPLARRFLAGSAHLHGLEGRVTSFTRGSISVTIPSDADRPIANNAFVIANDKNRYDFKRAYYRTYDIDTATNPTLTVEAFDDDSSVLPFTSPQAIGSDPIYGRPGSDEFLVRFTPRHGLLRGFGFTVAGATGSGNITAPDLNKEHVVARVDDERTVAIKLLDSDGNFIKFGGVPFSPFDVYRVAAPRPDEADFYMQFANPAAVTAAGVTVGTIFRLDNNLGLNVNAFYGQRLRLRDLFVVAIVGSQVFFRAGFGPGGEGLIITGASAFRDDTFGGNPTFFFDQASAWNVPNVMQNLKVVFCSATDAPRNPAFVGSFIYDPKGVQNNVTVSRFVSRSTQSILKGSNDNIVFVDKVKGVFKDEDFPTSGSLIIDYGTDRFEGPVRYIATISNNSGPSQIILDPSYRFKSSHPVGTSLQFIHANVAYVPDTTGSAYPVYITGTAQARNTLFALLELLIAAGIFLKADVILPELKYQDPAIPPFA